MKAKFLFLGSGGSMGVPEILCSCATCRSTNPKNKRLRPSALLQVSGKNFLLDIGPDFRQQALKANLQSLEGLILTHSHFDHTACIDELRIFSLAKKKVSCLLSEPTYKDLQRRFYYLFEKQNGAKKFSENQKAEIDFQVIEEERLSANFFGLSFSTFRFFQGSMPVHGYRFKNLAYVSDIRQYPESIFKDLEGVETLILSASSIGPNKIHFNLSEAISFAKKLEAKRVYFTHLSHRIDYERDAKELPEGMFFAYDGLELDVEVAYGQAVEGPFSGRLSSKR